MKAMLVVVMLCVSAVMAWDPLFEEPVLLGQSVGGCADPFVADWDDDGVDDLIVGQYSGGKIKWF
ncbi:MAG: hypothetical protein KAR40_08660 [Candidatus Sabulitectum sp.]|nr:hypothetical protein [Candidatus Sabulitectum sp.]